MSLHPSILKALGTAGVTPALVKSDRNLIGYIPFALTHLPCPTMRGRIFQDVPAQMKFC